MTAWFRLLEKMHHQKDIKSRWKFSVEINLFCRRATWGHGWFSFWATAWKMSWCFMLASRWEHRVILFACYSTSNNTAHLSTSYKICQTLLTRFKKTGNKYLMLWHPFWTVESKEIRGIYSRRLSWIFTTWQQVLAFIWLVSVCELPHKAQFHSWCVLQSFCKSLELLFIDIPQV